MPDESLSEMFINTGMTGEILDPINGTLLPGTLTATDVVISEVGKSFKSGRAWEVINGRLAMVGITAALVNETLSGNTVFKQLMDARDVEILPHILLPHLGFVAFEVTVAVVLVASLFPPARNVKRNGLYAPAEPFGPFTPLVEIVSGRAAMLGLVSLCVVETFSGSALL